MTSRYARSNHLISNTKCCISKLVLLTFSETMDDASIFFFARVFSPLIHSQMAHNRDKTTTRLDSNVLQRLLCTYNKYLLHGQPDFGSHQQQQQQQKMCHSIAQHLLIHFTLSSSRYFHFMLSQNSNTQPTAHVTQPFRRSFSRIKCLCVCGKRG